MKKLLATAIASLAFIGAAYAAVVEGTIQSVDTAAASITLDDGKTYKLPAGAALDALTVGAKVKVTVDDTTGTVTAVEAAS